MKKVTLTLPVIIVCTIALFGVNTANSANQNAIDEAAQACIDAARLIQEDDDLEGAIEEATWCLTGLKQLKDEIKLSLFPDELNGYKGGDIEDQTMMGLTIIERNYQRDNNTISLSLTSTSSAVGNAAAGGLGAIAELGKLFGAMASADIGGGKKIRIQKRTVVASDLGGNGILNIELKSGGSLKVQSSELDSDELVEFIREFPLAELDDAMGS